AIEKALQRVSTSDLGVDDEAAARNFLTGMQEAAASLITRPPADLFHPSSGGFEDRRDVTLPDGGTGSLSLRFSASVDPASGLMREAERMVVTRVGQSERRTIERWSLSPA